LGTVIFAALVLVLQECQLKPTQTGKNLCRRPISIVLAESFGSKGKLNPGLRSERTQEFQTPAPFWLASFSDTIKGPMRQMYFVVLLPNGRSLCRNGGAVVARGAIRKWEEM
jgi:hypothetical protein